MLKTGLFHFCLIMFFSAQAQKFSIGAKAGLLASWSHLADKADRPQFKSIPKPGISVAGLINFPLKNEYSFQAEGGASRQGRIVSYNDGTWKNNCTYYFADMNMMLRKSFQLHVLKDVPSNWFLNIGPNINYWISSNGRITADPNSDQKFTAVFNKEPTTAYDKMYLNNVNRWLFGLNLGIGFNASTARKQRIFTELRVTWASTYLGKKNSAAMNILGFEDNLKANLAVINLSVAYVFDKDIKESRKGGSTYKIKKSSTKKK